MREGRDAGASQIQRTAAPRGSQTQKLWMGLRKRWWRFNDHELVADVLAARPANPLLPP
jgi:hypothetical protein